MIALKPTKSQDLKRKPIKKWIGCADIASTKRNARKRKANLRFIVWII
jgi:hypothetical protein